MYCFKHLKNTFSSVQLLSPVQLFATPWTAASQASLFFTISQSLLKHIPIKLLIPSNHLILCCPLLLLPSIFPNIKVYPNESVLRIRWPKYWSFSFNISPSNEYSGLISFTIDWFDIHAVKGTLKSLLQHHNSKASILWRSTFSLCSNSHNCTWLLEKPQLWLYGPLSAKWCLCFLTHCLRLSAFLPGSNHLLISWLQSPSAVILTYGASSTWKFLELFEVTY